MKFFCEVKTKSSDEIIVCIVCILCLWYLIDLDVYNIV